MVSISFPLIAQLLSAAPESKLPACCRRDGAHGCARNKSRIEALPPSTILRSSASVCPLYPGNEAAATGERMQPSAPGSAAVMMACHTTAAAAQMDTRYRISFDRSFQKRGPP
jgi:hypothetical protein